MEAKFIQDGKSIDIVAEAKIAAGDVVISGELIGVAKLDIPANAAGSIALEGVYEVAKGDAVFAVGAKVYFDTENRIAVAAGGEKMVAIGVAVAAAAAAAETVLVRIG